MKRFSILLPTRNRLDLLRYAVETVRGQDFQDWELVISDNFSDEDTNDYVASLEDSRILCSRTDSFLPVTENWNRALSLSSGEYVIMLGDDDGLVQGSLTELDRLIAQYEHPDFIFTDTLQFNYPGVISGISEPFIQRGYAAFWGAGKNHPHFLDLRTARKLVNESCNFRLPFVYNMQQSITSRTLIEKLSNVGPFFQSPYPDYYATNALFLNAERILINPTPLLFIGVSPKSFGFYYFNKREKDGNTFLNNQIDPDLRQQLENVILPGTEMNTSWLASMEILKLRFGDKYNLRVNHKRYRLIQTISTYRNNDSATVASLLRSLSPIEKFIFRLFLSITPWLANNLSKERWEALKDDFERWWSPQTRYDSQFQTVESKNLLDVYQWVKFNDPQFRRPQETKGERPSLLLILANAIAGALTSLTKEVRRSIGDVILRRTRVTPLRPSDWEVVTSLEISVKITGRYAPVEARIFSFDAPENQITSTNLKQSGRNTYEGSVHNDLPDGSYIIKFMDPNGMLLTGTGFRIKKNQ